MAEIVKMTKPKHASTLIKAHGHPTRKDHNRVYYEREMGRVGCQCDPYHLMVTLLAT